MTNYVHFSIVIVTRMHVTVVYISNYTFYHKPSQLSYRTPLINTSGSSSIVISENFDRSVKTLHQAPFF